MTTPKKKPKKKPTARKPAAKKPTAKQAPAKRQAAKQAAPKKPTAPKGYQKNPTSPTTAAKMAKAVALFEDFTGHAATHYDRVELPDTSVCVQIGHLDGIAYEAVRDGKLHKYFHKFTKSARPLFAVTHDGEAVVIVGGRFRFTERGIVDQGSTH